MKDNSRFTNYLTSLKVGSFLAVRQVKRTSLWTNILVTFIMVLTFLNLVVVSGVLVGLIEGAVRAIKNYYLGDIFISNLKQHAYIERSQEIINNAKTIPGVEGLTWRYIEGGAVKSNYKVNRRPDELDNSVGASIVGIDPIEEDKVTHISSKMVEGEFLEPDDFDQVVLGAMLLKKYLDIDSAAFGVLEDVEVGDKVQVRIGEITREVTVKGIIRTKVDEIDRRVIFTDKQLRGMIGRSDYNVDEIVLRLAPKTDPAKVKEMLLAAGAGETAKVQTQEEAEPKFVKDMKKTFATLGTLISSIGLVVAAITIFIVIFINAITRRKFIGILKGVGVRSLAIEWAYVLQSIFYAVVGTVIGILIVYGFLEPYLSANPINFPFSDGILVVPWSSTLAKAAVLLVATLIAGYVPAKLVTKQNTLDSILNR